MKKLRKIQQESEAPILYPWYKSYLEDFIAEELKKAKNEGKMEVLDKIKEIYEWTIPYGLYAPSEMEVFNSKIIFEIQKYYIAETSKLKLDESKNEKE